MKIAIIILAAGASSRMGSSKQLLPYKNTTLLGNTIEQAVNSNHQNIYCVLGANADTIKASIKNYPVETILNQYYQKGLSTSIVTGIKHIENQNFEAALILLADQPTVNSAFIKKIVSFYLKIPEHITASYYKNGLGVPAIFPKEYFSILKKLTGDKGARNLLNSQKNIRIFKRGEITDIDTPEEYKNLLNKII